MTAQGWCEGDTVPTSPGTTGTFLFSSHQACVRECGVCRHIACTLWCNGCNGVTTTSNATLINILKCTHKEIPPEVLALGSWIHAFQVQPCYAYRRHHKVLEESTFLPWGDWSRTCTTYWALSNAYLACIKVLLLEALHVSKEAIAMLRLIQNNKDW